MTKTKDVDLTAGGVPMRVYEARPDDGGKAAVIVIQEAFGVNAHIEDVTRRYADAGFHAVSPELFHRTGQRVDLAYDDMGPVMQAIQACTNETILEDVDATIEYLRSQGWKDSQIGIVGFCMGGRVTFLTSVRRSIGAGVGYYGGMIVSSPFPAIPALIDEAPALKTPWLGIFGDQDKGIPVEGVEQLRDALKPAKPANQIIRYADADHGFFCNDRPAVYNAEAAADSWPKALAWFNEHLVKS